MRQSQLFTKTRKEAPKDEVAKNAQLLIRAGYIHKEMAGVYSYLPLGLRVLKKIEDIIREEMNAIGGQEIQMATLHPSENWKLTGGWDNIDVLFKVESRTGKEYAIGQSEEEIVTPIAKEYISSYKDLPLAVYQIGQKYRDELRAKSGIMRGREFGMKDMYSFHDTQEDFDKFYGIVKESYFKVYERLGLVAKATEADGGSFSKKISYEFMVLTDAGEDNIFYCNECSHCANEEVAEKKKGEQCPKCGKGTLEGAKASEVGNIFDLSRKYGEDFKLTYKTKDGGVKNPIMGCYGIGTTRLMGVIVEKFGDKKGIVWPESVAPFKLHLVVLDGQEGEARKEADRLYDELISRGVEVLYDDREARPGEKFADADLIGIPHRAVISDKTIAAGQIELYDRAQDVTKMINEQELVENYA